MHAVCANRLDLVLALRTAPGIKVDASDHEGNTALILAAYAGLDEAVIALRDMGINAADVHGDTALIIAANENHIGVVNILLQAPDINVNSANRHALTALHCAALADHQGILCELLKADDIDVNAVDDHGHTALMLATASGHSDSVELLHKDPRIDLNSKNLWFHHALMLIKSNSEIAAGLRRDADVMVDDETQPGPWMYMLSHLVCCVPSDQRPPHSDEIALIARDEDARSGLH